VAAAKPSREAVSTKDLARCMMNDLDVACGNVV
jgi:hypothetical protein